MHERSLRFGRYCFNCLTAHRVHGFWRTFESDNPIGAVSIDAFHGWQEVLSVASAGAVCEDGVLLVVGRRSHLERLQNDLVHGLDAPAVVRGFRAEWDLPRSFKASEEYRYAYDRLTNRNKLMHVVAEHRPDLRLWAEDDGHMQGGLEVQFKENLQACELGGCIL